MHRDGGRLEAFGPALELGPKATLSISLLPHEMATNAAKYGALSAPDAKFDLSWLVDTAADPMLRLTWRESRGPPVLQPTNRSFGSRLIQIGSVGKGGAVISYPVGLAATFEAAMSDNPGMIAPQASG